MTLEMILYKKLHSAIGLNLAGVQASASLGIRAMNVELRDFRIEDEVLESSTASQISFPTISQQALKNSTVNPSGPGAFPLAISLTTPSTSWRETGLSRALFCSSVMRKGMEDTTSLIASCQFTLGSVAMSSK